MLYTSSFPSIETDFHVSLSYSRGDNILFYISYSEKPLNGAFPVNKM